MSQHISSINCMGCALRSKPNEGVLGHTNCSEHRPCTGRKYWEPEDCLHCSQNRDHMSYMSSSAIKLLLAEFRAMLTNVQTKLKLENSDRVWKFEPIFPDFFSDYIHLETSRHDSSEYQQLGLPEDEYTNDVFDDAESTGENYETFENEELFDGNIANAGEQVFHERLSREPVCNHEYCAFSTENAQCNDPVHIRPSFKCIMTKNNLKRQRSPSPTSIPIPTAMSPRNNHPGTQSLNSEAPPAAVDISGVTPQLGHKLPLVDVPAEYCREARKTYYKFTKERHTRKGQNHIDIIEMDPTNTFVTTHLYTVEYKPRDHDKFSIVDEPPSSKSPYIRPTTAGVTFASAYTLQNCTADIKKSGSDKNYLDSDISTTSGLNQVTKILHTLDNACSNTATGLSEEHLLTVFEKDDPKEAFEATNFVNFRSGWTLTSGGYEKFAKDEPLRTDNMRSHLITHLPEIKAKKHLLTDENETRQAMLHCFTTLHYQELLTNKLELMSDEHKTIYGLTPDLSKSICRMLLPQLKYAIVRWMIAKMRLRKDILKDNANEDINLNIQYFLKQSLWDPDIFPKDSFTHIRDRYGVLHVAPLIGLSASTVKTNNPLGNNNSQGNNSNNNNNNYHNNGQGHFNFNKRLKTNPRGQRANIPSFGHGASLNHKRGGQQGRSFIKKQYNANNSATNNPKRQVSQRGRNRGNQRKNKTFRGGKNQNNSQ